MSKKKSLTKRIGKIIGIVLGSIVTILLIAIVVIVIQLSSSYQNLRKVDEDGYLYYMEYTGDYDNPIIRYPLNFVRGGGCSAFYCINENNEYMTGRNYDLPHKDKEGNITGLNVIIKMNQKGKYQSINVSDACWLSVIGLDYYQGSLDNKRLTNMFLAYLPLLCMDGMNEEGLCCSILALDLKKSETAVYQTKENKESFIITEALRLFLDECKDVNETIEKARNINLVNILGYDYHLFVTDKTGASVCLEWRYNQLLVTETDAVTNFYVGYDDAEDHYVAGNVKEKFDTPPVTKKTYHYGYGHGYHRFYTIVEKLDECYNGISSVLSGSEAMELLSNVKQAYDSESVTSMTQYSAIYNNTKLTLDICSMQDYTKTYSFGIE